MSRDYKLYLDDILECCQKIEVFTDQLSFEAFAADARTIDAVVRNIEIIGEAVKNVPAEWREMKPEIEWKKIARLRDIIVHHYFKVDIEVVWAIVQERIEELRKAVQSMLDDLEKSEPNECP